MAGDVILTRMCKNNTVALTVGVISAWIVDSAVETFINTPTVTTFILR